MTDNKSTRMRFSALMLGLGENYSQSLTSTGIEVRFKALMSFDIEDIEKAAMGIICSRKYTTMPTVADFLDHLEGGCAEDRAEVAVAKAAKASALVGAYRSIVFDDPVLQAVVEDGGGWHKFANTTFDKWERASFIKTYVAFSRQNVKMFGHLPGLVEIDNFSKGYANFVEPPVLFGNKQRALQVFKNAINPDNLPEVANSDNHGMPGKPSKLGKLHDSDSLNNLASSINYPSAIGFSDVSCSSNCSTFPGTSRCFNLPELALPRSIQ